MKSFKLLLMLLILYLMSSSTIYAVEEKTPFIALLENIDREEQEILSDLYTVKLKREKAEVERQRIEEEKEKTLAEQRRLAEVKRQEEEAQRVKEEKAEIERIAAETKKQDALLEAEKEKIAEKKYRNRQLTAQIDLSKQQMKIFKGTTCFINGVFPQPEEVM